MTNSEVLKLVSRLVEDKINRKIYPHHLLLIELYNKARKVFEDYNHRRFKDILIDLINKKYLFKGRTINNIWISTRQNNIKFERYGIFEKN